MQEEQVYTHVLSIVRSEARTLKRREIIEKLRGKFSDAQIDQALKDAVSRGDLITPKRGLYKEALDNE